MNDIEFGNQEFMGFKIGKLREAFTAIENKKNWKFPIEAVILKEDFEMANAAAIFFAESTLEVKAEFDGKVQVYGKGYYLTIGA